MSKKPSLLILALVIIYLAGLIYLSFKKPPTSQDPKQEENQNQMIAPDGTILKGPTSPPGLAPSTESARDPLRNSTGPTFPPPQQ